MGWWILAGLVVIALARRKDSAATTAPASRPAVGLVDMSNDMVDGVPAPNAPYVGIRPPSSGPGFYVADEEVRYWHDLASAARAGDCTRMHEVSNLHA